MYCCINRKVAGSFSKLFNILCAHIAVFKISSFNCTDESCRSPEFLNIGHRTKLFMGMQGRHIAQMLVSSVSFKISFFIVWERTCRVIRLVFRWKIVMFEFSIVK